MIGFPSPMNRVIIAQGRISTTLKSSWRSKITGMGLIDKEYELSILLPRLSLGGDLVDEGRAGQGS
jgi:hypothetical protein